MPIQIEFESLDSTNQEAKRYLAELALNQSPTLVSSDTNGDKTQPSPLSEPPKKSQLRHLITPSDLQNGVVILAKTQTHGRGQFSRTWNSVSEEGLYYTYLARWDIPLHRTFRLPITIAKRIQTSLQNYTQIPISIKAPNDLMIQTQKVGGILIETTVVGKTVKYGIIGVGLNVNQADFPPDIQDIAISLFQASKIKWDKQILSQLITKEIQTWQSEELEAQPLPKSIPPTIS